MKKIITSILMAATIVSLSTTNILAAEDLLIDDINIVNEGLDVVVETEDSSLISEDDFEESLDADIHEDLLLDKNIMIETENSTDIITPDSAFTGKLEWDGTPIFDYDDECLHHGKESYQMFVSQTINLSNIFNENEVIGELNDYYGEGTYSIRYKVYDRKWSYHPASIVGNSENDICTTGNKLVALMETTNSTGIRVGLDYKHKDHVQFHNYSYITLCIDPMPQEIIFPNINVGETIYSCEIFYNNGNNTNDYNVKFSNCNLQNYMYYMESSNPDIAEIIDLNDGIIAKKAGTTIITGYYCYDDYDLEDDEGPIIDGKVSISGLLTVKDPNAITENEIEEKEMVASQIMNLDTVFEEGGCIYNKEDVYAKRYTVDDKKLASISKNKLKANKIGTVKVTQEVKWDKTSDFEPTATCEIRILPKPALKFSKPLTYEGQTINGFDCTASSYCDLTQYKIKYWRSSNSKVAEVDEDGIIIAKGQGTTTISAYIEDEGITNKIVISAKLTVKYPKFNKPSYTYKTGDKIVLAMKNVNASLEPEFEASGENINVYPQLDKKGNPTGKVVIESLSCGDATLTAIIDDQEYTCDIHVTAPKINKNKLTLRKNKYTSLSLSNTKIKKQNVVWESENDSIATIDEKGRIKGISEGEVIIFTNTGGIRNECIVTVK